MRASDMRDMTDGALQDQIVTAKRDLFGLRMQAATGELDNTARLRHAKRELARALTIARERGVDPNVKAEADNG
jgi:large subunit ribosomal protein L29